MAKNDNSSSSRKTLRMSMIRTSAPAQLASGLIQKSIFSPAITPFDAACGFEDAKLGGLFNWLLDLDTGAKTLRTGGAKAINNPDDSYCFLNASFSDFQTESGSTDVSLGENGDFSTKNPIPHLVLPIFLDHDAVKLPILLPLYNVEVLDAKLSGGGNCIGRFRGEMGELSADCKPTDTNPNSPNAYLFEEAGKVQGVISLEEADRVKIVDLNQTLCVLLTGVKAADPIDGYQVCLRDGAQLAPDVLAAADSAITLGGANDSMRFSATFAASSVKINPGDCNLLRRRRQHRPHQRGRQPRSCGAGCYHGAA